MTLNETNVMYWFYRDITDLELYSHKSVVHNEITIFDPTFPEVAQIGRVSLDRNGQVECTLRKCSSQSAKLSAKFSGCEFRMYGFPRTMDAKGAPHLDCESYHNLSP